jgi:alpha-tubulin suppressor-like RCC1 family protein
LSWGSNSDGETKVPAGLQTFAVAVGGNFSLALKAGGTVVGWGGNNSG